jgi:hypothetical protein
VNGGTFGAGLGVDVNLGSSNVGSRTEFRYVRSQFASFAGTADRRRQLDEDHR